MNEMYSNTLMGWGSPKVFNNEDQQTHPRCARELCKKIDSHKVLEKCDIGVPRGKRGAHAQP